MGDHHPHNHAGSTERDPLGVALHISVEAHQPNGEGKARQRIPPLDRGFDAGQQISRRQHIHQQDLGRGVGNFRARGSRYGGGVSQQHEVQPLHLTEEMGRVAHNSREVWNLFRSSVQGSAAEYHQPRQHACSARPTKLRALSSYVTAAVSSDADAVLSVPQPILQHSPSAAASYLDCCVPDWSVARTWSYSTQTQFRLLCGTATKETCAWIRPRSLQQRTAYPYAAGASQQVL